MIESVEMLYYNVEDKCYGKFSHSPYFLLNKNSFYSINFTLLWYRTTNDFIISSTCRLSQEVTTNE